MSCVQQVSVSGPVVLWAMWVTWEKFCPILVTELALGEQVSWGWDEDSCSILNSGLMVRVFGGMKVRVSVEGRASALVRAQAEERLDPWEVSMSSA